MKHFKFFMLSAFFFATGMTAHAQKFHEIIFCNTTDAKIGATCAIDERRILSEIGKIAESIGYEPVEYVYNSENCSKENLMSILNTLNCTNKDVVFFYYSGHGIHADGGLDDKFPQMCLKYSYHQQSNFVPVRVANEMISRKNPRLSIILSDCCNDIDEAGGISVKKIQSKGITTLKRSSIDNYRRLFAESEGSVIATGCKLGQTSGCTMYEGIGGFFTFVFCEILAQKCEDSSSPPTWENLLSEVKKSVAKFTDNEQEPYYVNNVRTGGSSSTNTNVTPTPPAPTTLPSMATNSPFSQAIAELLSTDNMTSRLNLIPRIIQRCFGGKNATIITVGRNLTTVVDYEDIRSYLNRLAANKKIIGINVLKEETDSSGKQFITVTEVRTE